METVEKLVQRIKEGDRLAEMLGIEIMEVKPGYAKVRMKVLEKHLNSVNITHGGSVFTLADMAFALASNSHGRVALALNMNISFLKATKAGDLLSATAMEDNLTNRTGLYRIVVQDQTGDTVSVAQGLVYRKKETV